MNIGHDALRRSVDSRGHGFAAAAVGLHAPPSPATSASPARSPNG
jgi:hypothetical protein